MSQDQISNASVGLITSLAEKYEEVDSVSVSDERDSSKPIKVMSVSESK